MAVGKASLTAQRPLLDGGEGELLPRIDDMELDTHDEQKISPTGANTSSLPPSGFPPNITALDASKNKRKRKATLANQAVKSQWTIYQGEFELPVSPTPLETHRGEMCPSGLALLHPAADLLKEWATYGCSTKTGTPWMQEQMQAAVDRGTHWSALSDDAIAHFRAEVKGKKRAGQARGVGLHKGQPAGGTQNLSNSGNTPQIETVSLNSGPFIQSTTETRGDYTVG